MNAAVSFENEQILVDLAVADAPEMTPDQIRDIRRTLKQYVPPKFASDPLSATSSADASRRRAA